MTVSEFRKTVKTRFPHVKISVRTIGFADLARDRAKCLTVSGERSIEELKEINELAKLAGILPDTSIRSYK